MSISYKTNSCMTTQSLTEWFFGKKFLADKTDFAQKEHLATGNTCFRFWQNGTGYLTIEIH